jgi:hypothetical protein
LVLAEKADPPGVISELGTGVGVGVLVTVGVGVGGGIELVGVGVGVSVGTGPPPDCQISTSVRLFQPLMLLPWPR